MAGYLTFREYRDLIRYVRVVPYIMYERMTNLGCYSLYVRIITRIDRTNCTALRIYTNTYCKLVKRTMK